MRSKEDIFFVVMRRYINWKKKSGSTRTRNTKYAIFNMKSIEQCQLGSIHEKIKLFHTFPEVEMLFILDMKVLLRKVRRKLVKLRNRLSGEKENNRTDRSNLMEVDLQEFLELIRRMNLNSNFADCRMKNSTYL